MIIHGLTVCVNYSDMLSLCIDRWMAGLASLTVVTDMADDETVRLAESHRACVRRTNIFYERGATFNKAGAMQEGRGLMPDDSWHLFFDADIVPPDGWRDQIAAASPKIGNIYGAWRHEAKDASQINRMDLPRITTDGPCVGYFQMFHNDDRLGKLPLPQFTHGGVYDCEFKDRWPHVSRVMLPLYLIHVGERDNWFGRGNKAAFDQMMCQRRINGNYESERLQ